MFVFVFDAVVLFGLARLTDLIMAVHAARAADSLPWPEAASC